MKESPVMIIPEIIQSIALTNNHFTPDPRYPIQYQVN
jgi:hypothetical protein